MTIAASNIAACPFLANCYDNFRYNGNFYIFVASNNKKMSLNPYTAEQSAKTPMIHFSAIDGVFELKGKSIPENAIVYYKPLIAWLDEYIQNPVANTKLTVQLDYFNTSSSKCIVDIFKKLELIPKNGKGQASITWKHDAIDDDMQEAGEDYKSIINIPFHIVSFVK
jgi:hypothetical protein